MDGQAELNERVAALRRAILEVTFVVEAMAEMISASGMAAARDLLTPDHADDVATQMKVHLLNARDALHQANRPVH